MARSRVNVQLPQELGKALGETAKTNSHSVAALLYSWIITAARLAAQGHGDLLPQESRAPRGTMAHGGIVLRWSQDASEFNRCRDLIVAAGSSVPAVMRTAAQAYVEAGGDALAMTWPPKSLLAEVA